MIRGVIGNSIVDKIIEVFKAEWAGVLGRRHEAETGLLEGGMVTDEI